MASSIGHSKTPGYQANAGGHGNHYNSVHVVSNGAQKGKGTHLKKNTIDPIAPRMNHSFIEDGPKNNGGASSIFDKNNSTFENNSHYLYEESRARLFSEERPSQASFLPRLDASQRYSNSQVIHRDHHN